MPLLFLGKVCRSRKAGHKGGNCCGMCKVPNTPNLGAKPSALHWALQGPMMPCHALVAKWVGGLHVWGLSLPRVGRLGVANVGLLQAWSAKVPKMAHCRPKTANRWLGVPDWSIVFQKQTLFKRVIAHGSDNPRWIWSMDSIESIQTRFYFLFNRNFYVWICKRHVLMS